MRLTWEGKCKLNTILSDLKLMRLFSVNYIYETNMLKITNLIVITIGLIATSVADAVDKDKACPNGFCPGLGELFYLPEIDTVGVNTNGTTIWKKQPILGECAILTTPIRQANDAFKGSDSASSFFSSLATDSNVSGDVKALAFSMKASASAQTGKEINITSTFHSQVYDRSETQGVVDFNKDESCQTLSNISDYYLNRFKSLPADIAKPGGYVTSDAAWAAYLGFLKDLGSHYLVQMTYGSRFQIWSTTTTTSSNISTMLKARACLEIEGSSGTTSASATGCTGIDSKTRDESKSLDIQTKKVVRGGIKEKREALVNKTSPELMADFIKDAPASDQPITWKYLPVWQLLQTEYLMLCQKSGSNSEDCKNYQRALNLQAAFEGREAWQCDTQTTSGVVIGGMKLSEKQPTGGSYWSCVQAKTGCFSDNSCNWHTGTVSHCYGPECLDEQRVDGTQQFKTVVKGNKGNYNYYDGVNNSCYVTASSFWTKSACKSKWAGGKPERAIWTQNLSTPVGSVKNTAFAADVSTEQSAKSAEIVSDDDGSYLVTVRIAENVKAVSKSDEKPREIGDASQSEGENTVAPAPRSFIVLSYPVGINCPGASCTHRFKKGDKVTVGWVDNSKDINFVKWDSDRCVDSTKHISINKLTEYLNIENYDGPEIPFEGGNEASVCTFNVDEDIILDAEIRTKGDKN